MPWFAVCNFGVCDADSADIVDDRQLWTVTQNPTVPGWDTDGGCEGYGLTKAEADFLVAAANEKEARDGASGPWEKIRTRLHWALS